MRPKNLVNICQKEYFFTINFVRAKYNKAIFILQWRNFSRVSKVLQYRDGFALLHSRMEWGKLPFSPSITSKAKTGVCRSIWSFNILPAGDSRVFHCRPCPGVGNFNRPGWVEKFEPVEYTRSLKVESPLSWENALEENFHIVEWRLREETNKRQHKLCLILQNLMITRRPFVMLGWGIWTHFLHGVRQFEWANCQKFKCPGGMLKIGIYRCISASGQNIFRRLKSFAYICSNLSSTHCDISLDFLAFIWFACPWRVPIV